MKVGIDGRFWSQTGVGRYTRNLVKNLQVLDKKNEYVLFLNKDDYDKFHITLQDKRWKIVKTDILWHSLKEQLLFPRILKKENLDLMHFPYFSVPLFYKKPFNYES